MMHTAKYMHQILDISLNAYDELFADINLEGLVEKKGIMYVWEKKGIKSRIIEINIRKKLGERIRNQMRKVPEIKFFLDDSVDYSQQIEDLLN